MLDSGEWTLENKLYMHFKPYQNREEGELVVKIKTIEIIL